MEILQNAKNTIQLLQDEIRVYIYDNLPLDEEHVNELMNKYNKLNTLTQQYQYNLFFL